MTVNVNSQCNMHYLYIFILLNSQNFVNIRKFIIHNIGLGIQQSIFAIEFTVSNRFTPKFPEIKQPCKSKRKPFLTKL
jgi:hypothetical protein